MILLTLLAFTNAAVQCSASFLPGTPKPEIQDFEFINPDITPEGEKLFESDILLTEEQWEAFRDRKAIDYEGYRWPEASDGYPLVHYVFDDSKVDQSAVKAGIDHWMEHTCIKFEETTNINQAHLKFYDGNVCESYIGLQIPTGQKVSIGSGCISLGTVAHEIGHAMGFWHEQSRSDRDEYVVIKYDNIRDGKEGNFASHGTNNYNINYDYGSDMHYGGNGFTKNGKMTLVTKDPFAQELIGSRTGLSHRDKLMANKMYKCIDKWLAKCGLRSDPCKNEGYLGAKCMCVCPTGVSGANCETVYEDYYAHLRSKETETITTEIAITSGSGGTKFTKKIVAPKCKKVKVTFDSFDLYKKLTDRNGLTYCYHEYVFLRFGKNLTEGNNYCEQDISAGQSFTSETDTMIIYSETPYVDISDGWSAKVEFVQDADCTASTTSKPTTKASTTVAPTTTAPTTAAPATAAPTTATPTTKAPATPVLTTTTPKTAAPTTLVPTTAVPTTKAPTTPVPTTAAATTVPTTADSYRLFVCDSISKTWKIKAGDCIQFISYDYPNNYSTGRCALKLKGDGIENVKVTCSGFDLEPANKKGKCKDFLKIGTEKYCGNTEPVDVTLSVKKLGKLSFKANKRNFGKGFRCYIKAY